ncbi:MAG: WD40 repeat domain-containing protein [Pseudomonadota bacterium]|nr:WD40 repeat domain-containing protein [Pseudomonadota bacterium]
MNESKVRIFVSSPADVEHERAIVKDVIDRLGQEFLPYFEIESILWEEEALTADRTFQAGLLRPSDCDIVLVVLWTRIGSPLPEHPYKGMTGTEWEFFNAVEASAKGGGPEVLVYKKTNPKLVDITNPQGTLEAIEDRKRLEAFFQRNFFNEDQTFSRAFREFDSDSAFRSLLEMQLRKLLNRRILLQRRHAGRAVEWRGSPFRADRYFEFPEERIFTGRESEIRDLITRLEAQQAADLGFILIAGPSGCGKSSLLRAGLLPRLVRPYQIQDVAACRWCVLDPRRVDGDPLRVLAEALCKAEVLGNVLHGFGIDASLLSRTLAGDPVLAVNQIQAALDVLTGAVRDETGEVDASVRLAVLVDPLESVFKAPSLDTGGLESIDNALAALARSPQVWVLAALRSDYLRDLPRLKSLAPLVDEEVLYSVDSLEAARIRQVMEIPALVAGLEFEPEKKPSLVELLEKDAGRLRHWPPFLQECMQCLYESKVRSEVGGEGGEIEERGELLQIAVYEQGDRLKGTVLRRAERAWGRLDQDEKDALPVLCRALISLERMDAKHPSPRTADLDALEAKPACRRLISALIEARLLVAEGHSEPVLLAPCTKPDYSLYRYLKALGLSGTRELLSRVLRPFLFALSRSSAEAKKEAQGVRRITAAPDEAEVKEPLSESAAAEPSAESESTKEGDAQQMRWKGYWRALRVTHPTLIQDWSPIRDWLSSPENRQTLILRHQISRQAQLWKRTDCNREYLLAKDSYEASLGLTGPYGSELESLEAEFLDESRVLLRYKQRRNIAVYLVGLLLLLLSALAVWAALEAHEKERESRISLHKSELARADLDIEQGNRPSALKRALQAGKELPERAISTLSRAFVGTRLLAMVKAGDKLTDQAGASARSGEKKAPVKVVPDLSAEGGRLVSIVPGEGVIEWSFGADGVDDKKRDSLAPAELGIHSLFFVGEGAKERLFGIGESGVWSLSADSGAKLLYHCGAEEGAVTALDADGRFLAIAHPLELDNSAHKEKANTALCVVDLNSPAEAVRFGEEIYPAADKEIRGLAFSPIKGDRRLVTGSAGGRLRVLDVTKGELLLELPEQPLGRPFNRAVFDSQGKRIAVASADDRVRVYSVDDPDLSFELSEVKKDGRPVKIHHSAVRDVAFSADGRYLVAVDDEGQVVRWNLEDLDVQPVTVLGHHRQSVQRVRVSSGSTPGYAGGLVLTASKDGTARLWDLFTGKEVAVLSHDTAVSDARFEAGGNRILTHSAGSERQYGSARVWNVDPLSRLYERLAHKDHVWHLDVAADDRQLLLATAGYDGCVRVWRYDSNTERSTEIEFETADGAKADNTVGATPAPEDGGCRSERQVRRVAFSPSGRLLASAAYDGTARIWTIIEPASPVEQTKVREFCPAQAADEGGKVDWALFGPDESWFVTASDAPKNPVRVWRTKECGRIEIADSAFSGLDARVQALAVTGDPEGGALVAAGDERGRIRVVRRDGDGWTTLMQCSTGDYRLSDLAFSPDADWLAFSGNRGLAGLLHVSSGDCGEVRPLEGHGDLVYSVRFAPDGQRLVTASLDKTARVWTLSGRQLAVLGGHNDRVYHAEFSPDGDWILTASRDKVLRIWEAPTGVLAHDRKLIPLELDGRLGGVSYATFSPDGLSVAAAYWDNAALLWRLWKEEGDPAKDEQAPEELRDVWDEKHERLEVVQKAYGFWKRNHLEELEIDTK